MSHCEQVRKIRGQAEIIKAVLAEQQNHAIERPKDGVQIAWRQNCDACEVILPDHKSVTVYHIVEKT